VEEFNVAFLKYLFEILPVALFGLVGGFVSVVRSSERRHTCWKATTSIVTSCFSSILVWALFLSNTTYPVETKIGIYMLCGLFSDWTIKKLEAWYKSKASVMIKEEKNGQ